MKVGLEVSAAVSRQRSGVGNYVANMLVGLQGIAEANADLELIYFSNRDALPESEAVIPSPALYPQNRLPIRSLWIQWGLPRSIAQTEPDLCHFPNYLAPITRPLNKPFLVTMYDMTIYRYPQYQPLKTVAVHRAIVPTVARQANQIITISESARQDILHYLKVPAERVRVINGNIGPHFLAESAAIVAGQPLSATLRPRYDLDFPYILMVGTLEPRKNHARLIEAFTTLVQQERLPHHLVLVGAHGWKEGPLAELVQKNPLKDRLHFLGYVPASDLPGLYRAAAAFAFPSIYEGFGLPVLEAMACGTPCLISTDPALLELAGLTAVATDPFSTQAIAAGLYRLLTDTELVSDLRQRGLKRAAGFTWERCAAETYRLYQEVFENYARPRPYFTSAADSAVPEDKVLADTLIFDQSPKSAPPLAFAVLEAAPSLLEQAIMETILYADIFNFPLTIEEIQLYLIRQRAELSKVSACLTHSVYLGDRLSQHQGYFCLRGREAIFDQRLNQLPTVAQHWQTARRWGRLLQLVPFLRSALVTGALAADSARPGDDIDLLLLVEPGRIWTCRALVIGLVYLARLTGVELCPNYLIACSDAALTLTQRNLYAAREFAGMRLVWGQAEYWHLQALNSWVYGFLPQAEAYSYGQTPLLASDTPGKPGHWLKRVGEKLLRGRLGEKFEQWEQRKITRFNSRGGTEACFSPDLCKGHFGNYGQETLLAFAERCAMLDLHLTTTYLYDYEAIA
jgi:glycosyltransferase involved in cell wall biosynthesis